MFCGIGQLPARPRCSHGVKASYCVIIGTAVLLQARDRGLTVTNAGPALASLTNGNVTIDPALNSTAHSAALAVFGISPENAKQAQGQRTSDF